MPKSEVISVHALEHKKKLTATTAVSFLGGKSKEI